MRSILQFIPQSLRLFVERKIQAAVNLPPAVELHDDELRVAANQSETGVLQTLGSDCDESAVFGNIVAHCRSDSAIASCAVNRLAIDVKNRPPGCVATGVLGFAAAVKPSLNLVVFRHPLLSFLLLFPYRGIRMVSARCATPTACRYSVRACRGGIGRVGLHLALARSDPGRESMCGLAGSSV